MQWAFRKRRIQRPDEGKPVIRKEKIPQSSEVPRGIFLCESVYRDMLLTALFESLFKVLQCAQELHPLQAPQEAQLPPQELLPAFLSRIMLRISRPTIRTMTATRTILIRLAESHVSTGSHPFGKRAARRPRVLSHRAAIWRERGKMEFTVQSASVLPCRA